MMKAALFADHEELSRYVRCIPVLEDVQWVGYFPVSGTGGGADLPEDKFPPVYSSPERLLEAADIVLVAGRPEQRFDYISRALRRGKAVWSEWPVSQGYPEACKLSALAEEARVCHQVAHISREHPVMTAARPWLDDMRMIRVDLCWPLRNGKAGKERLEEILFPYVDRVMSLEKTAVKKVVGKLVRVGGDGGFVCRVLLEFNSGLSAEFWVDGISDSVLEKMRCIGPNLIVDMDFLLPETRVRILKSRDGAVEDRFFKPELLPNRPLRDDLAFFVQACRDGRPGRIGFGESRKVQEVLLQISKAVQPYE